MARSKTQIVERREAANAEKKVARKSKPALTARMSTGGKGPTKATIKSPKAGAHQKSGDKDANYETKDRKSYKEMVQDAFTALPKRKGITMAAIRSFLVQHYGCTPGNAFNGHVRRGIQAEWESGTIQYFGEDRTKNDGDELKYNKRFTLVK